MLFLSGMVSEQVTVALVVVSWHVDSFCPQTDPLRRERCIVPRHWKGLTPISTLFCPDSSISLPLCFEPHFVMDVRGWHVACDEITVTISRRQKSSQFVGHLCQDVCPQASSPVFFHHIQVANSALKVSECPGCQLISLVSDCSCWKMFNHDADVFYGLVFKGYIRVEMSDLFGVRLSEDVGSVSFWERPESKQCISVRAPKIEDALVSPLPTELWTLRTYMSEMSSWWTEGMNGWKEMSSSWTSPFAFAATCTVGHVSKGAKSATKKKRKTHGFCFQQNVLVKPITIFSRGRIQASLSKLCSFNEMSNTTWLFIPPPSNESWNREVACPSEKMIEKIVNLLAAFETSEAVLGQLQVRCPLPFFGKSHMFRKFLVQQYASPSLCLKISMQGNFFARKFLCNPRPTCGSFSSRLGEVRWGEVRWGEVRWGEVRWGEVRWGEVRWGEV